MWRGSNQLLESYVNDKVEKMTNSTRV